jgi:hypothetical protein
MPEAPSKHSCGWIVANRKLYSIRRGPYFRKC